MTTEKALHDIITTPPESRFDLWRYFIDARRVRQMAEIGVFRGEFAATILQWCKGITRYYMIDPWQKLEDWNKPANVSDDIFARVFAEAIKRTAPWKDKRVILRGRTTEVADGIPDGGLDFAYIDGDHTLRGIAIDLMRSYPKVREGGCIGGDDLSPSIWQHPPSYEPTLVFPFAVYFAEAVNERIFALPHNQFLIEKQPDHGFEFVDLTGSYGALDLKSQLRRQPEHR